MNDRHEQHVRELGLHLGQLALQALDLDVFACAALGDFFQLADAVCEPKPQQDHLPLLIGGKRDRMLRIVARHADQWNMWGLPDVIAERGAELDRACSELGRDPAEIVRSAQALVRITDDPVASRAFVDSVSPRAAFAGTTERAKRPSDQARAARRWLSTA